MKCVDCLDCGALRVLLTPLEGRRYNLPAHPSRTSTEELALRFLRILRIFSNNSPLWKKMFWNYDYVHVKVRIHGEKLHVMPKLHRLSTPDIVARYIAVVEFSPAFATFRVFTIAYLPSQLRKFQCSANQISHSHKSHGWLKCHSSHVSRKLKSSFRQAQKETHTPVFFFDQWRNQWNEKV